jgi:hypothetical protein
MQFVNPLFLFGLFAIAIPVAIHLFNFRRYRKIYFSNVDLLRNFQKKTRKQSELLHLLVLAARILTIIALVTAFAQPYIPMSETVVSGSVQVAGVFVDNSFSMEAADADGRKLDEAKRKAADIAMAYDADDLFQLLTNDFESRHQRLISRDEFLMMLRDIKPGPVTRSFSEVHSRQSDLLRNPRYPSASSFLISDFQYSTILSALPDSSAAFTTYVVPVGGSQAGNLYIDTCWFENPVLRVNQTASLQVKISNISENNLEKIPVRLIINGEQRAIAAIDIEANSTQTTTLSFSTTKPGQQKAVVEISDYPVIFDDSYFMAFAVSEFIPLLAINQEKPNPYLTSVFAVDSVLQFTNTTFRQTNFSTLSGNRLVILNGASNLSSGAIVELIRFVEQGGSVVIFPSEADDMEMVNQMLASLGAPQYGKIDTAASRVAKINKSHIIFNNVFDGSGAIPENTDLPFIRKHYSISKPLTGVSDDLMTLDNGDPLFTLKSAGSGKVYLSAVSLGDDWGNFPRHALFVPVILNIAFESESQLPLMYYTQQETGIKIGNVKLQGDNVFRVSSEDGSNEFIPEVKQVDGQTVLFMRNHITDAGIYNVRDADKIVNVLAFNFNRKESDLRFPNTAQLNALMSEVSGTVVLSEGKKEISKLIAERNHGRKLWKWFIIAALIFILSEVLLLRFFRKKSAETKV